MKTSILVTYAVVEVAKKVLNKRIIIEANKCPLTTRHTVDSSAHGIFHYFGNCIYKTKIHSSQLEERRLTLSASENGL